MNWRRLTLSVEAPDVEAASALLSTATGASVSIYNGAVDLHGRPLRSIVSVYVPENRSRAMSRRVTLSLASARRQGLLRSARRSSAKLRDEDWATGWKRFYKPSKLADGLYVVPSWRTDFQPPRGARTIQLDPGMAFGTGQHATTRTALRLLLDHVQTGKPMLDIGCGSGVLGLAAAQRGAKVYACDIDPIATAATRENFRANGLRAAAVKRASGVPADFPRAPLIVANITADALSPLARAFASKLTRGGTLVTSGVTARGRAAVLKAFSSAGLRLTDERKSGEWLSHVHLRADVKGA
jgi:ribosomal protein L11 methyltransferase